MATHMVEASQRSGFRLDSLAVRKIVKMVYKTHTDHKYLLSVRTTLIIESCFWMFPIKQTKERHSILLVD